MFSYFNSYVRVARYWLWIVLCNPIEPSGFLSLDLTGAVGVGDHYRRRCSAWRAAGVDRDLHRIAEGDLGVRDAD